MKTLILNKNIFKLRKTLSLVFFTLLFSFLSCSDSENIDVLEEDVSQYMGRSSLSIIQDDDRLEKEIKSVVRKTALAEIGKKPELSIIISRLS